jgi:hypothetical protein
MEGAQRSATIGRAVLLYPTVAISRLTMTSLWRVHSASRLCTRCKALFVVFSTTTIRAPAAVAAYVLASTQRPPSRRRRPQRAPVGQGVLAKSPFVPVCPMTTSWPIATRPRWSKPNARFPLQACSGIWCKPRLCRGPAPDAHRVRADACGQRVDIGRTCRPPWTLRLACSPE